MFYLSAAALFVLLLPMSAHRKLILLLTFLPICACVQKRERVALRLRHPLASLLSGGLLTFDFYLLRRGHSLITHISKWSGVSASATMALIAALTLIASLPMIDAILSMLLSRAGSVPSESTVCKSHPFTLGAILICAAIALLASLQFSIVPFSNAATGTDSSVFLYIGQRMHDGFMPYRDIFDHKGPALYLINWLGLFLHTDWAPYLGVWLFELLNMFAFAYGSYQLLTEIAPPRNKYVALLIVAIVCVCCGNPLYIGGNLSEEFALPWIVFAIRIFLRFFRTNEYRFREVLLLGLGLGFVLCLRPNLIGVWAVLTPVVLISLLKSRRFADIGSCALAYSLGIAIVLLPLCIWLCVTGSFSAFLECYFKFNFAYSGVDLTPASYLGTLEAMLHGVPFLIPAIAFSLPLVKHRQEVRISLLALIGSLVLICISGRKYQHYALPLLPLLSLLLAMPVAVVANGDSAVPSPRFNSAICLTLALGVLFFGMHTSKVPAKHIDASPEVTYLQENTLPEDDVLVLGQNCRIYLQSERYTRNRFIYQKQPIRTSEALRLEFLEELRVHPSDVILIPDKSRAEALASDDVFTPIYQLFDDMYQSGELTLEERDGFYLYRRVQA